jgi:penicillin-binding protein 2
MMSLRRLPYVGVAVLLLLSWGCGGRASETERMDRLLAAAAAKALGDRTGAVVVMDVKTGRIRAIAGEDVAVGWAFPPGSLVKLVTVWEGLEEEKISPDTRFTCTGKAVLSGKEFTCWYPPGHGELDLVHGIAYSCNIYFFSLAEIIGPDVTYRGLVRLGFGERTGVNLPMEEPGRLLPSDPVLSHEYVIGDTDKVTATPLQVITYFSALVNGGKVFVPTVTPTPRDVARFVPTLKKTIDVSRAAPIIARGMRGAATYGTATEASVEGHEIMGKTGTGGFLGSDWATHAWFVGFAPADDPRIGVVVFLYRGTGAVDAAPAAREVFRTFFGEGGEDKRPSRK